MDNYDIVEDKIEGIERLEEEVSKINNRNIEAIWKYLKTRKDLYDKFNNKEKSITQMYNFIYEKAKKQKIGNVAMIEDNMVYSWAVIYFIRDNKELGLNEKNTKTVKIAEKQKNIENNIKIAKKSEKAIEKDQMSLF